LHMDNGARPIGQNISVDYRYGTAWRDNMPNAAVGSSQYFDTLNAFTGIRFQIPPGIGAQDTVGDAGTDTKTGLLANGDSVGKDAGCVTFKVRIR
jgi:hypothetical protein